MGKHTRPSEADFLVEEQRKAGKTFAEIAKTLHVTKGVPYERWHYMQRYRHIQELRRENSNTGTV